MDVFQDPLFRDLEKLNFTVNEAKVYLTLIKIGASLTGKISKESRLDRSSTYNALKALIERGIVTTIHENKRTIFVPEDPKKILDYYKEKEEVAKSIIPRLSKQFSYSKQKTDVKLFRGFKGLKTVFQEILDQGNDYIVLGSEGQFGKRMPYYAPIFRKRKELAKIKTKSIIRESREKLTKGKFTEYRKVPSDVESPATINIYDDKVAIFIWEEAVKAVLIENKDVAKTLENYFNFMWKHAKK